MPGSGMEYPDPEELYTGFRVKRLPQEIMTKAVAGRVEVALFIPEKTSEGTEVFIAVKPPGRLDADRIAGESQLQLDNAYHKPSFQQDGTFRYSKDKTEFKRPLTLDDGYFTESNLSASDMVKNSRTAIQIAG